jgi:putative ATPase
MYDQRTILFIDEIHRFNKAQQDAFLPFVEDGTVVLIGATTENPSFEVIAPLLALSRLHPEPASPGSRVILRALTDRARPGHPPDVDYGLTGLARARTLASP